MTTLLWLSFYKISKRYISSKSSKTCHSFAYISSTMTTPQKILDIMVISTIFSACWNTIKATGLKKLKFILIIRVTPFGKVSEMLLG